jgi:hypothetical protein
MPHADPTWSTHNNLITFNNNGGFIWAGCHAVSVLENLYNPATGNPTPTMNFLSTTGLVPFGSHSNGTPPYTYTAPGTGANQGGDPVMQFLGDLDDATLNGSGGWNRVPFWPVNSLDVDTYHRVDARLTRSIPISERVKGSLMFEGFNIFNTITNTGIATEAFSTSGGIIKPTAGLGAGTKSEGFPDGTNARRLQVALRFEF